MHVVRQRRRDTGVRSGLLAHPRLRLVLAGTAVLAVVGSGAAYGTTTIFGQNKVGQEYADGLQISSDQILKPLGDRADDAVRQVHGHHRQPGRPLPGGHLQRPLGVAAGLRPVDVPARLARRHRGGRRPPPHRQHGRTGGPGVLAGRQVPLHAERHGHQPVPGESRRHARGPHQDRHPDRRHHERTDRRHDVLRRRQDPVRRRQRPEHGGRDRPDHGPGHAHLERRHRPAPGGARRGQALRLQRGRPAGDRRRRHPGLLRHRCARRPHPGHVHQRHAQRHRPRRRGHGRRHDQGRVAPDRDVRQGHGAVRRQHQRRHRLGGGHDQQPRRPDHRDPAVARLGDRLRPDRHDRARRPPARQPRSRERRRGLQAREEAARPGQLRRAGPDRLLPRGRVRRRREDRGREPSGHRRPWAADHLEPGLRHHAGDVVRHARHHRLADPVHAPQRPVHPRAPTRRGCSPRTAGATPTPT